MRNFANFSNKVFLPPCSKSTIALIFKGSPSSENIFPLPKRSCSTFIPTRNLSTESGMKGVVRGAAVCCENWGLSAGTEFPEDELPDPEPPIEERPDDEFPEPEPPIEERPEFELADPELLYEERPDDEFPDPEPPY